MEITEAYHISPKNIINQWIFYILMAQQEQDVTKTHKTSGFRVVLLI